MERTNLIPRLLVFLGVGAWIFLLVSLGSFHSDDWPSHQVFPYPATQNLCGKVGALVAYYLFCAIGQGVFPVLFFGGICLALLLFGNRVSDLWLRVIGLVVLTIAFASAIHLIRPGSPGGFPEGNGGVIGIGA